MSAPQGIPELVLIAGGRNRQDRSMGEHMGVLDEFAAHLRRTRRAPSTIRLRVGHIERLSRTVDLLSATEDELLDYVIDHEWQPNTRQSVIVTMRVFYDWAHRAGHVRVDPAAGLESERLSHRPARIIPEAVLHDAVMRADWEDSAALLLAGESGLRVSEIAGLPMDARDGEWLRVRGKGGRERMVPLSPELKSMLVYIENALGPGFYFRSAPGNHVHPMTIYKRIHELTGFNPHSLRHRAATEFYHASGRDIRLTQEFLGHASPNTTMIYVHVSRDDMMNAMRQVRVGPAALIGLSELTEAA